MKLRIFLICVIFFLSGCGYNSIYSNKNSSSLLISEITATGDKRITRQLLSLLSLKEVGESKNSYVLNIETRKKKKVAAKDKQGNASIYELSLEIIVSLRQGNNINKKKFVSNFSYNNIQNKFELSRQENTILENLMESMAKKIILFIYS
jgi:outer membrane lipopolysaccharide assembly protein LptE/RlpB